jgi:phage terminase large subunit
VLTDNITPTPIQIRATEAQRQFLDAILQDMYYERVAFGGARGGGKTFISALAMVVRRIQYAGTFGLMLRRVQKAADKNLGEEIRKACRLMGLKVGSGTQRGGVRWLEAKKEFHFPNGSIIVLGYCRTENDWEQYQGLQYTDIAFEEANQFDEAAFNNISGSSRKNIEDARIMPKVWITFNPGGLGTEWTGRRFGVRDPKTADTKALFIQSLLKHSKALLEQDPGYRDRVLKNQPEWRRKQWEDGDWDSMEGQFFQPDPRMYRDQDVPYWAEIYAGVDAGYFPAAFAVVWVAVWNETSIDGKDKLRVHVWRELKQVRMTLDDQATNSTAIERIDPIRRHRITARFADPAAWKRSEGDGGISSSTAMVWAQNGFVVTSSTSNARSAGWMIMRNLMNNGSLTIDSTCKALRMEIESAIHDDKTDDIKQGTNVEDHLLDALRYVLLSTVAIKAESKEDKDTSDNKRKRNRRQKSATEIRS